MAFKVPFLLGGWVVFLVLFIIFYYYYNQFVGF